MTFDAFTANPISCSLTYSIQSIPSLPAGLLSFDSDTRTMNVNSNDSSHAGMYSLTVIALNEAGAQAGTSELSFSLEVPWCGDDTIIAGSIENKPLFLW